MFDFAIKSIKPVSNPSTHLLDAEPEYALHVLRPRYDEGVVHPDPPERGDPDGPGVWRGQDSLPRHGLLARSRVRVDGVLFDVLLFAEADPRMHLGTVERQQVPNPAPRHPYGPRRVEDRPPTQVGYEEAAQGVGDADADAET